MKVTQLDERTFKVILSDAELDDLMHEAVHSDISSLDVMKSIFLMTFVQVMSCRYFRRILIVRDKDKSKDNESHRTLETEVGG